VGQARIDGGRAADRNAELFCEMLVTGEAMLRGSMDEADTTLLQDKLAHSPAAMSWRSALAWIRAAEGRDDDARRELASVAHDGYAGLRFDANWLNAVGELAEACRLLADRDRAAELYAFLEPYAGRNLVAGRAVASYGVADRHLGLLAATMGRHADAIRHLEQAITGIGVGLRALGCAHSREPWGDPARGRDASQAERARDELARAAADARRLELTGLERRIARRAGSTAA